MCSTNGRYWRAQKGTLPPCELRGPVQLYIAAAPAAQDGQDAENGIFMVDTLLAQTLGRPLVPWMIKMDSLIGVVLVQQ